MALDGWSDEIYPISEFRAKQKHNPAIPFFQSLDISGKLLIPATYHYLFGEPKIKSVTNAYKNQGNKINKNTF